MNEELPNLIEQVHDIAEDAQKTFGTLSAEQLNWKPNADQWSVAQCLEHLIVSNAAFFPLIKKIANGEYRPSFRERLPLLPRFFGSVILGAVQPQAQRKFKAGPKFLPSSSAIDGNIVSRFKNQQQEVIENMKMTQNLNLRKIIITSPVASFATYSLLDAFRIVVAHEQRHLEQAKRVMKAEGFPKHEVRGAAAG